MKPDRWAHIGLTIFFAAVTVIMAVLGFWLLSQLHELSLSNLARDMLK